jgi:hypothetical protein
MPASGEFAEQPALMNPNDESPVPDADPAEQRVTDSEQPQFAVNPAIRQCRTLLSSRGSASRESPTTNFRSVARRTPRATRQIGSQRASEQ